MLNLRIFYSKNISWALVGDQVFVFDEIRNTINLLVDISKDFWLLIQYNDDLLHIINELTEIYNADYVDIKDDILHFVEVLANENLLVWSNAA